jgi:hypothetical protein
LPDQLGAQPGIDRLIEQVVDRTHEASAMVP